ncbi:MAG: hypothetical protein WCK28_17725 [Burkholderiales bacterium]|jgi:uncharacterized membrane protein YgcG
MLRVLYVIYACVVIGVYTIVIYGDEAGSGSRGSGSGFRSGGWGSGGGWSGGSGHK